MLIINYRYNCLISDHVICKNLLINHNNRSHYPRNNKYQSNLGKSLLKIMTITSRKSEA